MNAKSDQSTAATQLRRHAETRLRARPSRRQPGLATLQSAADTQRLLHELQVHQVELELQNAELQATRDRAEILLAKYTDLYNFAPAGYFSLDEPGRILEANLTGATLLGPARSQLIHRRFQEFVAPAQRRGYRQFLDRIFAGGGKEICQVPLQKTGGVAFWAELQAVQAAALRGSPRWCRVAVTDITHRKEAEAAHQRAESLTATNLELGQELVRQRAVEDNLKQNQEQQAEWLEKSHHMQAQLRHLSHQILQAQEEERKRISRELHDEITQTLVGINVHLGTLSQAAEINPRELRKAIARTQRLVEKSIATVHQFARELRPTALDDLGLTATLKSYIKELAKRTGLQVHFTTFAGLDSMDSARRTVCYRVVQSALTNVAQHAHATRVRVSLRRLPRAVGLEIADDGKSFDVEKVLDVRKNKRLGVLGMRERVEMVGGSFTVVSAPGQGTTIRAEIPFRHGRGKT
jgi:PAS domain S-box-containing protein